MASADSRYLIVFNGEIYNYVELRQELVEHGAHFRGTSDTEVLLHLFIEHGAASLDRLDGMFAFAVYDTYEHRLFCARDHLGEKPLYYVAGPGYFAFSSEVRALVDAAIVPPDPDWSGIGHLLRGGSIPPPHTHIARIKILPPACSMSLEPDFVDVQPREYWSLSFAPERISYHREADVLKRLDHVLSESITRRSRADVPVGAFLSVESTPRSFARTSLSPRPN